MHYDQIKRRLGGPTKIAQVLGLKHKQTVQQWSRRKRIPSKWQIKLERITGLPADKLAREDAREIAAYLKRNGA